MKSVRKEVYKGKIFTIIHTKLIDKNGKIHIAEQCTRPDVVTIIGITDRKEIVMIKEFRPGMEKNVFWLPGGKIFQGENPKKAALREFEEETSFHLSKLYPFHKKYPSDNFINNGYVYIGNNPIKIGNQQDNKKEKTRTVLVPIEKAVYMALHSYIPNEFFCYLIIMLDYKIKNKKLLL